MCYKVGVSDVCHIVEEILQGCHTFRFREPWHTGIQAEWRSVHIIVSMKVVLEELKPLCLGHCRWAIVQLPTSGHSAILLMYNIGHDPEARVGVVGAHSWAGADG